MSQLKEYTNPRINKAVEYLYSQVFLVTQCKQVAADDGNHELAEKFAQAEAMARLAVEELRLFEAEVFAAFEPSKKPGSVDGGASPLLGV